MTNGERHGINHDQTRRIIINVVRIFLRLYKHFTAFASFEFRFVRRYMRRTRAAQYYGLLVVIYQGWPLTSILGAANL